MRIVRGTLFQFAIIDSHVRSSKFAYVTAVVKTGGFSKFVLVFVNTKKSIEIFRSKLNPEILQGIFSYLKARLKGNLSLNIPQFMYEIIHDRSVFYSGSFCGEVDFVKRSLSKTFLKGLLLIHNHR